MLTNERIILKMSLEQKVRLMTSTQLFQSSSDGGYDFPVYKLAHRPLDGRSTDFSTAYPSDAALASSWNLPLVSKVYEQISSEVLPLDSYAYFRADGAAGANGTPSDGFFGGNFNAFKIKGLNLGGQNVNFNDVCSSSPDCYDRLSRDIVMSGSKPDSVIISSSENAALYARAFKYGNLYFAAASTPREAAEYIHAGCSMLFLKEDFTEELITLLYGLTAGYKRADESREKGEITLSEFNARCRNLEILDERLIDNACDALITSLMKMKSRGDAFSGEFKALDPDRRALFDEKEHDDLAYFAAKQSAVLLKNDGVLPLKVTTKVAIVGDYADKFGYQREYFSTRPTAERVPFQVINDYDIDAAGFACGYARGESGRSDLIHSACALCREASLAIVYLCADNGEKDLPEGQKELLNALFAQGTDVVAVVASDGLIDLSFAEKCKAVLLTFRGGQRTTDAVLDILTGECDPSGRLIESALKTSAESAPYFKTPAENVIYPFGYGLSYTTFEYRNLKIGTDGLSCTVQNTGDKDGYATVQFYVRKEGTSSMFADKVLRGFTKVFVKKNDGVKVRIPFDENTFRVFDEDKGCYRVEGGEYKIFLSENYFDDKLTGTVTLSDYLYLDEDKSELKETSDGKPLNFTVSKEQQEIDKAKNTYSFGLKLFVAILLAVYYNGVAAILAFSDIVAVKDIVFYCIIGAVAGIFDILFIVYVVLIAKKRKKQRYLPANEVLTDMLEHVDEFSEIAKVVYKEPLPEQPEEEEEVASEPEISEQPEEEVEEKAKAFDFTFTESVESGELCENVTAGEICVNFKSYAASRGVNIDAASARSLIAATGASKIILLDSKNTEVLPEFLQILSDYFGGCGLTAASESWSSEKDLLWREDDGKYVVSAFADAVHTAAGNPAKNYAAVLTDVSLSNVESYFSTFIGFANHPTEKYLLNLGDGQSFAIPDNIVCFLAPDINGFSALNGALVNASLKVDLALDKIEKPTEEDVEIKQFSHENFEADVRESRENNFIDEKLWKKIDELFETINASERFKFGNKNVLQLEKYQSLIIECGGDENEALISSFLAKIVPALKLTAVYRGEKGEATVFGFIEKLFPEEDLTAVQKSLGGSAKGE